ncbi:MAG: phosphatase PAP2 family protein [Halopenitus sp.]
MIVLLGVLAVLLAVVATMCLVAGVAIVGTDELRRLRRDALPRVREAQSQVGALLVVVVASGTLRGSLQTVSELYGWELTPFILAFEGPIVAWIQSTLASPVATLYFSATYIYGYVFLLVFPFILYGLLPESAPLKRLLTAYALNYGLGLVLYTLVFAYGPRNVMPDLVKPLLFTFNPEFMELAAHVNENTNVFPSLHTSLSVTVAAFAWRTREAYPAWTALATWLAASVMLATMYLAIHWLVDVIAGTVFGLGCVALAIRLLPEPSEEGPDRDGASVVASGDD